MQTDFIVHLLNSFNHRKQNVTQTETIKLLLGVLVDILMTMLKQCSDTGFVVWKILATEYVRLNKEMKNELGIFTVRIDSCDSNDCYATIEILNSYKISINRGMSLKIWRIRMIYCNRAIEPFLD